VTFGGDGGWTSTTWRRTRAVSAASSNDFSHRAHRSGATSNVSSGSSTKLRDADTKPGCLPGLRPDDQLTDDLLHAVDAFPHTQTAGLVATFASTHDGEAASAVRTLIDVWLASADGDNDRLIDAYDCCLGIARWAYAPDNWTDSEQFLCLMLRQATADRARLPDTLLDRMAEWYSELVRIGELPGDIDARVRFWAQQVIPRLNE
jgi:hypothetical protein